jgi:putative phosphoesterase
MKIIIFADIHANLTAFDAVLKDIEQKYKVDAFISLGDFIDYGMRSNEIIERIQQINVPLLANLKGNHEKALIDGELSRFSSERGRVMSTYTKNHLTEASVDYINNVMQEPKQELTIDGQKVLLLHGDIIDPYWGKLTPAKTSDEAYMEYDYVLSGHIHQPYLIETFFKVDNPLLRNQKKTTFINPGSVGQPRNINPNAQYVYLDFETGGIHFNSVPYDYTEEQKLFPEEIDKFYSERLKYGI